MDPKELKNEREKLLKKSDAFQLMLKNQKKIVSDLEQEITTLSAKKEQVETECERRKMWLEENYDNLTKLQSQIQEIDKILKEST